MLWHGSNFSTSCKIILCRFIQTRLDVFQTSLGWCHVFLVKFPQPMIYDALKPGYLLKTKYFKLKTDKYHLNIKVIDMLTLDQYRAFSAY